MKIICIYAALSVVLISGCSSVPKFTEERESLTNLGPMDPPRRGLTRHHQIDVVTGKKRFFEVRAPDNAGLYTGVSSDGCEWDSRDDFIAPPSAWRECGTNTQWRSGMNKDLTVTGAVWPLEVGKSVSYTYTQYDSAGQSHGKRVRKCEVDSATNISVAAGDLDVYKVVCIQQQGDWRETIVRYFSPELKREVKYVRHNTGDGIVNDHELINVEEM